MKKVERSGNLSSKKRFWFSVVAFLIPILFLLFIELFLRLIGYGHNPNLVVEYAPDSRYYTMNPYASRSYFSDETIATKGLVEIFEKQKSKNTVRIFVLGESTTIGFPYGQNGSFHTWLKYRLMHSYPDKNFEIINFGLTAVNSYTALGFAKELVDYEPDAVLVYLGHNEYVGSLGVGSTSNLGSNRTLIQMQIALRRLKLVQLMSRVLKLFSSSETQNPTSGNGRSFMKTMVANQSIELGSDEYKVGIEQYRANLDEICAIISKHKIPLFLSNLVSNEANLPPLDGVDAESKSLAMDYYSQANRALSDSNFVEAKRLFIKALDADKLRFRAPSEFNAIIASIVSRYPRVYLADSYSLFEENSTHKILGKELLLEHVHPNLIGYALISDAFFIAMQKANIIVDDRAKNLSFQNLIKRMPVVEIDSLKGAFIVQFMKTDWPFNEPDTFKLNSNATFEEKMACKIALKQGDMVSLYDSITDYYQKSGQIEILAKMLESSYLSPPFEDIIPITIAKCYFTIHNDSMAGFYLKKAFDLNPSVDIAKKGVDLYLSLDEPSKVHPFIIYLIDNKLVDDRFLTLIQSLEVLKKQYVQTHFDKKIGTQIGLLYLSLGREDVAKRYGVTKMSDINR